MFIFPFEYAMRSVFLWLPPLKGTYAHVFISPTALLLSAVFLRSFHGVYGYSKNTSMLVVLMATIGFGAVISFLVSGTPAILLIKYIYYTIAVFICVQ